MSEFIVSCKNQMLQDIDKPLSVKLASYIIIATVICYPQINILSFLVVQYIYWSKEVQ